jgi:hypothetical protein
VPGTAPLTRLRRGGRRRTDLPGDDDRPDAAGITTAAQHGRVGYPACPSQGNTAPDGALRYAADAPELVNWAQGLRISAGGPPLRARDQARLNQLQAVEEPDDVVRTPQVVGQ